MTHRVILWVIVALVWWGSQADECRVSSMREASDMMGGDCHQTRVAFVSHGGGPLPVLGDPGHAELVQTLEAMRSDLPAQPSVIIVVSAHWETTGFQITGMESPGLYYDYGGFPDESYELQYPAPGAPQIAHDLHTALGALGHSLHLNTKRDYDHGVFIPLMLLYPEANIPVLEISLDRSLDAEMHWAFGTALGRVLPPGSLLIGSGFSVHNMRLFFSPTSPAARTSIHHFQAWLDETVSASHTMDLAAHRWKNWSQAEGGRFCHPREEHLLPLLVCHAAAQAPARSISFHALGVEARHYVW